MKCNNTKKLYNRAEVLKQCVLKSTNNSNRKIPEKVPSTLRTQYGLEKP